ncbi:mediator of RNA polymerase II transcription subunit 15-like [Teleopsis dalmanni]|uniref:mediator of RNA polymerase II transcription subunit 15-like n=1 Tax=Teleopsis dalmanni TaxID=139649 RepID=UPI0018CFD099|nr:mediator of RNA polymerase II transcription subunit 15-like [Teleopsis dalmanni]XP_037932621.1 mediator of RNA polymerase II transcription subunit 15-like [Teleopsis dalmanni]
MSLPNTTKCMPTTGTGQNVTYSVNLKPHGLQNKKSYQQQRSSKVKQATTVIARSPVTNTLPTLSMPHRSDSEPYSVPLQGKPQKQALPKCVVTPPQISTSHRESPDVCYHQAHAQQSPANRNQNTQPQEQKHQIEEHDLSSRPALLQGLAIVPESLHKLEPQPPPPVNQQQAQRETSPRNNHQSGPASSPSSTTSPQRKPTTIQPVSNNRHVQPTNPLDINVSDSKLNTELPSQETQAKDKVKRDSQQEPWSPQEELKVVQPSTKGNKPETLVRRLSTFKRKDDHHHVKNQDEFLKIFKSPKIRKRNRASS